MNTSLSGIKVDGPTGLEEFLEPNGSSKQKETGSVYGIILTRTLGPNLIKDKSEACHLVEQLKENQSMIWLKTYGGTTFIPAAELSTVFFPDKPMSMSEATKWVKVVDGS